MKKLIAFVPVLICVFALVGCANQQKADPFGHMYRVSETILPEASSAALDKQILVNLDGFHTLWIMEDTTTYDFEKLGELKEIELHEDDAQKGLWSLTSDDNSLRYELTVEEDDSIILSQINADQICWSYKLSRVDMVSVNVSAFGTREALEVDWYFAGTFLGDLSQLSSGTIQGQGKIGFSIEDEHVDQITLVEEYYTDGNMEYTEYPLSKEEGFSISAKTRYDSADQYAIYRIPYDNGEYIFYIRYR